jgi:hypothetical protein
MHGMPVEDEVPVPSWELIASLVDSPRRSSAWRTTGRWAVEVLSAELGDDWTELAWSKHREVPLGLANAGSHTLGFVALVETALRLQMLKGSHGYADLLRDFRRDRRSERAVHTALQLETACLALRADHSVILEPLAEGVSRPADLTLLAGSREIPVETKVLLPAREDLAVRAEQAHISERLWLAGARAGVTVGGHVVAAPREEELAEAEAWIGKTAQKLTEENVAELQLGPFDLRASRSALAAGSLRLWTVHSEPLSRLVTAVQEKAAKMAESNARWLRIAVYNGLWPLTPWGRAPLTWEKVEALRVPLTQALDTYAIDGIAVSSAAGLSGENVSENEVSTDAELALRVAIRPLRARETITVALRPRGRVDLAVWRTLLLGERDWLAWALARDGLPDVDAILAEMRWASSTPT